MHIPVITVLQASNENRRTVNERIPIRTGPGHGRIRRCPHQTRSLFSAIDTYGHVETIDGVIVALVDVLIWHLAQQPEPVRQEIIARFRQHLVDEIEQAVSS
jgi:hypothetical protein